MTPESAAELLSLVEELLAKGSFFLSAVELEMAGPDEMDGEDWERRALAAVAKAKGDRP